MLAALIGWAVPEDGSREPLNGLRLHRATSPKEPLHSVYEPVFCVIAQGSKEILLNNERYVYDPAHYLLVTTELPLVAQVGEASRQRPYLSLQLKLDPALVGSVIAEVEPLRAPKAVSMRAISVSELDAGLLEAVVKLVKLVDTPAEAAFLAPLITREIVFRLWRGEQG